jgi:hypothetical protein
MSTTMARQHTYDPNLVEVKAKVSVLLWRLVS